VFRGDVIDDAVDTADFVHDTVADPFKTSFGDRDTQSAIIAIFRMHGADGTAVGVGALIAHDADAFDGDGE
jgi:hypothetical protein